MLVTGAAGFVGANVIRRLIAEGATVGALVRPGGDRWRLEGLEGHTELAADVTKPSELGAVAAHFSPDVVIHAAAYGMYHFQRDARRMARTVVEGLVNVLEAFPGAYVVNFGSSSEYGDQPGPLHEELPLRPNNAYGALKAAATLYAAAAGGGRVATVRPFAVYGPWEDPSRLVPTLVTACLEGRDPHLSSPGPVRDFVHVDDVVDACLALVAARCSGVFNIGTGRQHSVGQVAARVIELTGAKVQVRWGLDQGRGRVEPADWRADPRRIREACGFTTRLDLGEGLARTIAFARSGAARARAGSA